MESPFEGVIGSSDTAVDCLPKIKEALPNACGDSLMVKVTKLQSGDDVLFKLRNTVFATHRQFLTWIGACSPSRCCL